MKGTVLYGPRDLRFVIGSFFASDNTCPHCHDGYQTSCQVAEGYHAMDERRAVKTMLRPAA